MVLNVVPFARELQKNSQLDRKKAEEIAQDWPFSVREYYLWYRMQTNVQGLRDRLSQAQRNIGSSLLLVGLLYILLLLRFPIAQTAAAERGTTPYAAMRSSSSFSFDKAPIRDQSPLYLHTHKFPIPFLDILGAIPLQPNFTRRKVNREFMQNCHGNHKSMLHFEHN